MNTNDKLIEECLRIFYEGVDTEGVDTNAFSYKLMKKTIHINPDGTIGRNGSLFVWIPISEETCTSENEVVECFLKSPLKDRNFVLTKKENIYLFECPWEKISENDYIQYGGNISNKTYPLSEFEKINELLNTRALSGVSRYDLNKQIQKTINW